MGKSNRTNRLLREVVRSKKEKEHREEVEKAMAEESKFERTRNERRLNEEAIKKGTILTNNIIKATADIMGYDLDDIMKTTVEKESYRRAVMESYIDSINIRRYKQDSIISFIKENLEISENKYIFTITFKEGSFEGLERISYYYGEEYFKIRLMLKNIPEMFHHLCFDSKISSNSGSERLNSLKEYIISNMVDYMRGLLVPTNMGISNSDVQDIVSGNLTKLYSLSEIRRATIDDIISDDKLTYALKCRFVHRVTNFIGFFMNKHTHHLTETKLIYNVED